MVVQVSFWVGVQDTAAFRFPMYLDAISNMPANTNAPILCSEIQINWGIVLVRLAKTAPAPRPTKRAGRAQHSRVDALENNVKNSVVFLISSFISLNFFNIVAGMLNNGCNGFIGNHLIGFLG